MTVSSKRLTSTEINAAKELLLSIGEELVNELPEDQLATYKNWLSRVMSLHPVGLLRPDHVMDIADDLYYENNALNGIVIVELTMRFFTLAGDRYDFIECLCQNIADGLCVDGPYPERSIMPQEWLKSTPMAIFNRGHWPKWLRTLCGYLGIEAMSVKDFLMSNKPLAVVLLLRMSYTSK